MASSGDKKGGFFYNIKDFVRNIGEKIECALPFGKPTAVVTRIHVSSINLHKAEIIVDVLIKNTKPVSIPLIEINYLIESDDEKLASGSIPDAGTIHAHGEETVKIPVTLNYDDMKNIYNRIKSTCDHLQIGSISPYLIDVDFKPGSIVPYLFMADLVFNVPGFERLTLPIQNKGEIPIPCKPDIDLERIHFERFSFKEETTVAALHLKLENKNDFDLELNDLDYEVWLGDVSIGGAVITKSTKIERQGITYIDLPITCRPKDFSFALWDMIRGRATNYTMKGNINADTPFGAMKLPISKEGGITRLKKNKEDGDEEDDELCVQDKRIHRLEGLRQLVSA